MKCPTKNCMGECFEVRWHEVPSSAMYCPICDKIFLVDQGETIFVRERSDKRPTANIPEMPINTVVYINNKGHKFFLELGTVLTKDHLHYRILFTSLDKELNGRALWIPDHWVDPVPKELLSKS